MMEAHSLKLVRLKHVSWLNMGQSPPSSEYTDSPDAGLPFLQGTADFGDVYPTPQVYCPTPNKVADKDDILISVRAPVGELNIADQRYGIGRGLCAVKCGRKLDREFAWWALHWSREQLALKATGSTYEAVALEDIADILLPSISIEQQQVIAKSLGEKTAVIDQLITAKERLITLLDEKRRALITHAVTRGLDTAVPLRDSGVEWIGRVPEHWEVVKLKMASESIQTGPFGSQLHAEEYIDNGIPVINPVHLVDGLIVPDLRTTVDDDTAKRLSIHQLETGDVVFARRGEIGRCSLVSERESGWLCGTGSLRVRLKKELIWPEYLNLFVSNSFASVWLSLMAVGTTMKNLNSEIIGDLEILVPPLAEQKTIVDYLDQNILKLQSLSQALQKTIALLQERRTALIAAAVSGQHPVADQS